MNSEESDEELVRRSKLGDGGAFETLVKRYQEGVFYIARSMLDSTEEAEDVAAEAFARAWRAVRSFRGDSGVKTWLWRITINLARTALRRRYLKRKVFFWKNVRDEEEETNPSENWPDRSGGSDPEKVLDSRDTAGLIREAKASLSARELEVFCLKFEKDLKISEIAGLLSIAPNTVKVLIFRATRKMAKALKDKIK